MSNSNQSRNLAARLRARRFRACRGVASARIRILFLLAGLLAMATPLRADNPLTYLTQFGSAGTGNGQFEFPLATQWFQFRKLTSWMKLSIYHAG